MIDRRAVVASLLILPLLSSTPALCAQETGSVSGVVTDPTGAVLPSTRVVVQGISNGIEREQTTGARGGYGFQALPVGRYRLDFERSGFAGARADVVIVEAGSDVRLDVTLPLADLSGVVEVRAEAPLIDAKRSGLAENVDRNLLQGVPNGRDVWTVLGQTPGVVLDRIDVGGSESGQQSIFSAAGTAYTQNQYYVNGVNATDPAALGASSTYYSYDSFEEVQVSTSGHAAEVQAPGVYLNIVVKDGSNDFRGGGALYFENDSLQADNLDDALRARGVSQSNELDRYLDYSLELGGPIVRDRAFFYANYGAQRIEPFVIGFFQPAGEPAVDGTDLDTLIARGTVQIDPSQRVSGLFFRNWKTRPFRGASRFRPSPETTLFQDSRTDLVQALYSRTFGNAALLDVRFSRMDMFFPLGEQPDLGPDAFSRVELTNGVRSGGPGSNQIFERERWQANASLFLYADDLLGGSHDLKVGWEQSRSPTRTSERLNGAVLYRDSFGAPFQVEIYNDPVTSENFTTHVGLFAQDSFAPGSGRLVLNAGLRFDRWTAGFEPTADEPGPWDVFFDGVRDDLGGRPGAGESVASFLSLAPRLGVTFSLTEDGRTILRAGYGRYFHQIGTGLAALANPAARAVALFDFLDANGNRLVDQGEVDLGSPIALNLPSRNEVDPNLRQPRTDEVTLGIERALGGDIALGATLIYRKDHTLLEDVNVGVPFSAFFEDVAVDPGRDLAVGTPDDGIIPVFRQAPSTLGEDRFSMTNPEGLASTYRGLVIEARKRYANGWQLLGSLTLSESEGFLPGPGFETAEGAGFATPLYDSPNSLTNADGRTAWDRPRLARVSASYDFRWGLRFAGVFRYAVGQPLYRSVQVSRTQSGDGLPQGPVEILAEPQGSLVQPDVTVLDLRVEKELDFGRAGRLGLVLDLFNALNANTPVEMSPRTTSFGAVLKILPPRVARIGIRYRF